MIPESSPLTRQAANRVRKSRSLIKWNHYGRESQEQLNPTDNDALDDERFTPQRISDGARQVTASAWLWPPAHTLLQLLSSSLEGL